MGLTIHYELSLPPETPQQKAISLITKLREEALQQPFLAVSEMSRFTEEDLIEKRPSQGLSFYKLEDVTQFHSLMTREMLYCRQIGTTEEDCIRFDRDVPPSVPTVAVGFTTLPGQGCEPAVFAIESLRVDEVQSKWWFQTFCKTQYASAESDEHFLTCHRLVVTMLDAALRLGFAVEVLDEGGYWESRDEQQLLGECSKSNRLVAHFAGRFTDAMRDAGLDSRELQAEIFKHPDFERLEMGEIRLGDEEEPND